MYKHRLHELHTNDNNNYNKQKKLINVCIKKNNDPKLRHISPHREHPYWLGFILCQTLLVVDD